jgi:hypothetical protein
VTAEEFTQCLALFQDNERTYPELTLFVSSRNFLSNFLGSRPLTVIQLSHSFVFQAAQSPVSSPRQALNTAGGGWSTYASLKSTPVSAKTPISATGESRVSLLKPKAGQLLSRPRPCYKGPKPWAYDIDASDSAFATAVRVLWDNSRIGKKTRSA